MGYVNHWKTAEDLKANEVVIPDLWHLAERLGLRTPEGKAVLEVWHLAHDLKNALQFAQK